MTKVQVINYFKRYVLKLNHRYDYWQAFEIWSAYIDGLCKSGEITQRQYENMGTPFPYGKHVTVRASESRKFKFD